MKSDLEHWFDEEIKAARREAKESHAAAMNSYGAGYDSGWLAALESAYKAYKEAAPESH